MPTTGRSRHLVVAAFGAGLLLICGLIARNGRVGSAERHVFRAINDLPAWLYKPLWVFQQFGNLFVALAIGVTVAVLLRRWWVAAAIVGAVGLKLVGERAVKNLVERSRPGTTVGAIHARGHRGGSGCQAWPARTREQDGRRDRGNSADSRRILR